MDRIGFDPRADRVFCGIRPTGIVWADRQTMADGDYKKLAFLPFTTLELEIAPGCPKLLQAEIEVSAKAIQAKRGQQYRVSACGQTVTLGGG